VCVAVVTRPTALGSTGLGPIQATGLKELSCVSPLASVLFLLIATLAFAQDAADQHPCAGKPDAETLACLSEIAHGEEARLEKLYTTVLADPAMDDQACALFRQAHQARRVFRNAECISAADQYAARLDRRWS
jgi:uncharacterized protein YecT (DUF1311 family)